MNSRIKSSHYYKIYSTIKWEFCMFSWYRSSSVSHTVCYMSISWFSDNHLKNLNFLALCCWTPCEFNLPCRSWHFADCILFSVCWLSKRKGTLILLISLLCPFHVKRMRSCKSGIVQKPHPATFKTALTLVFADNKMIASSTKAISRAWTDWDKISLISK